MKRTGQRDEFIAALVELQQEHGNANDSEALSILDALFAERDGLRDALALVLPLARGYAANHPCESSDRYIGIAAKTLRECDGAEPEPAQSHPLRGVDVGDVRLVARTQIARHCERYDYKYDGCACIGCVAARSILAALATPHPLANVNVEDVRRVVAYAHERLEGAMGDEWTKGEDEALESCDRLRTALDATPAEAKVCGTCGGTKIAPFKGSGYMNAETTAQVCPDCCAGEKGE